MTFLKMMRSLLLLCLLNPNFGTANYFCGFKCGRDHTVCKREPCSLSKACGREAKALPLNNAARAWVLHVHNDLRNKLALGQDSAGGNGQASNMRLLNYDKELEFVAQCWSNGCRETGSSHDTCRTTKKFHSVGQNMFSTGITGDIDYSAKSWLTQAVEAWYSEIKLGNANDIDRYLGDLNTGHFTQVVWAETTHVGCARTQYTSQGYNSIYIYCNYGVAGNLKGASVYKRGPPCSQCGGAPCNQQYKGLCGTISSLDADRWKPPFRMRGCAGRTFLCKVVVFMIFVVLIV